MFRFLIAFFVSMFLVVLPHTTLVAESISDMAMIEGFAKGYALTAESGNLEAVYKNPAAIASLPQRSVSLGLGTFYESYQSMAVSVGLPFVKGYGLGLHVPFRRVGDIPKTVENQGRAMQVSSFSDTKGDVVLTFGGPVRDSGLAIGSSVKLRYHTIDTQSGSGIGFNVGALYDFSYATLGAAIHDIGDTRFTWNSGHSDTDEMAVSLGLKTARFRHLSLALDMDQVPAYEDTHWHVGADLLLGNRVKLLAGLYDVTDAQQFRVGTSVMLPTLDVHYGYATHVLLGAVHKVGISVSF